MTPIAAILLALSPALAQEDVSQLPAPLVAFLQQYDVEAVDGGELRDGAQIRLEGTVRLMRWTLGDEAATRRDSVAHPRGIAIERARAHLAYCVNPREELAGHDLEASGLRAADEGRPVRVGESVIATGRIRLTHDGTLLELAEEGPGVLCDIGRSTRFESGATVRVRGVLQCVPGVGQECRADGKTFPVHGPAIRPSGRQLAAAALEGCRLDDTGP